MKKTMKSSCVPLGLVLFLLVTAAGCLSMDRDYPEKRLYLIDAERPSQERGAQDASHGQWVRFDRLKVSPAFENRGFIYRVGEYAYETDFYNEFFLPPGAMLYSETRQWLAACFDQGSLSFSGFVDGSGHLEESLHLEGMVNALYGDYRNPDAPRAVLEMQFIVIGNGSRPSEVLVQRDFVRSVELADDSPEALVRGWSAALAAILADFENELEDLDLSSATTN